MGTDEKITAMLVRQRSPDGESLFTWRCGRCHSGSWIDPYLDLCPDALGLLISQHTKNNNFIIQKWEGDLIADELKRRAELNPQGSNQGIDNRQIEYQKYCGECHTPKFIYHTICRTVRSDDQWQALIIRMRKKTPDFIPVEMVPSLDAQARRICSTGRVVP